MINSAALAPVNRDARPRSATHGGTLALEPSATVCHESAYMRKRSNALSLDVGKAPPTICPNRLREAIKVVITTSNEVARIGRREIHASGDGALTNSMSAFSKASSLRSRAETIGETLSRGETFAEKAREIALPALSKASCICEPRGGTNRAITRDETRRFFRRFRRALMTSCGCSNKSATAATSSSA